ncbi:MAG: hypothetical protein ACOYM7_00565 [Paludibacter sp.]
MKSFNIIVLLFIISALSAQETKRPSVEELHNRKWTFIVEKANLTAQEAERVEPIFMEYEKTIWKTVEGNKDFFKQFYQKKNNRSEEDYLEMNDRYINIEIQKTHLLKNYYAKLKKQLSSESIFKYFNAERSYRKELIDNWHGKHKSSVK